VCVGSVRGRAGVGREGSGAAEQGAPAGARWGVSRLQRGFSSLGYGKLLPAPVCWPERGDGSNFIQSGLSWVKTTGAAGPGAHSRRGGVRWELRGRGQSKRGMVRSFSLQHLGLVGARPR